MLRNTVQKKIILHRQSPHDVDNSITSLLGSCQGDEPEEALPTLSGLNKAYDKYIRGQVDSERAKEKGKG